MLEAVVPLFHHEYRKLRHDGVNLVFFSFELVINVAVGLATVGVFFWISESNVGLLNMVDLPLLAELLIAVMALDFFAQYVIHYLLHRVKWMWKLHMVHHSDTKVDATTGTRHHPGDYLIREVSAILTVIVFGIPVSFYVFYRMCTVFFTYATHANISMPNWLDKSLSYIFVTPYVHKFHHHFERPWTDTNFGNIFSIWDRIFGTFVYDDPKKIKYGLDVTDPEMDESIKYQLGLPMNKSIKTDY
jgi:sterol desaturase/sphingolipid hydroxylase (fatty acid hydroxylase superfamily)